MDHHKTTGRLCPVCHQTSMISRTKCDHCGHEFTSSADQPAAPVTPEPQPRVNTLNMFVLGHADPIQLDGTQDILLGRGVPDWEPGLDLVPFGAPYMGVSRKHAQITYMDGAYRITDLNSTNGTWLNEQRLQTDRAYPLKNGDTLRLGRLMLVIYMREVVAAGTKSDPPA
jgi:hypothetical protein